MENLSPNSLRVMQAKYLRKNERGEVIETPEECFRRVAHAVAQAEETADLRKLWEEKFFSIMANLEFLPGGRTLANAGTNYPQLANCFVLPMEDNIEEIFEVVKDSSILKKFGGGVGFSFSKIRPKGDCIAGTSGQACGPVALMKVIDSASEIFMQDGKRRSGNMVVLSVTHPDVLDFITAKKEQSNFPQVNYSLGVTDKFMKAVEKDKAWELINPRTGRVSSTVKARSIFEVATAMAWENGDPGMIFLDRINRDNPTPQLGPIEAVNLCGEQPLLPYEACNLGSINLTKFIRHPELVSGSASWRAEVARQQFFSESNRSLKEEKLYRRNLLEIPRKIGRASRTPPEIDWKKLAQTVEIAVRFLDDVIDAGRFPLSKVDRIVKSNRKIGLGIMGWADMLVKMQVSYDSQEALKLAERVMKLITGTAHKTSQNLGREKGNFPNFVGSRWQKKVKTIRNATCTTIAPTGSISMIAGVSSGIEPFFALSYYKEVLGGVRLPEVNADLSWNIEHGTWNIKDKTKIFDEIIKTGSIAHIKGIPETIKKIFVTAHEIPYQWHLKMQAAFQKYLDNAVSKTINLPNSATVEDVEQAFMMAWKLGCKGITIYRDKSRREQVLNIGYGNQGLGISKEFRREPITNSQYQLSKNKCPKCQGKLVREEGCIHCTKCGFSACEL